MSFLSPTYSDANRSSFEIFSHEIEETLTCGICYDLVVKALTTSPCMHTFCGACISVIFRKSRNCPICRKKIERVHKNFLFDSQVDIFIKAFPHKARSKDEVERKFEDTTLNAETQNFDSTNYHSKIISAIEENDVANLQNLLTHIPSPSVVNEVDTMGRNALFITCEMNNLPCLKLLLQYGADANIRDSDGATPLIISCYHGYNEIVKYLLQHGANIHARCNKNSTALITASCQGHVNCMRYLLDSDANVNDEDYNGTTALIAASCNGYTECIQLLSVFPIDINHQDYMGDTALISAVLNTHVSCIQLLIDLGANMILQNNEGNNIYHIATLNNSLETLQLICIPPYNNQFRIDLNQTNVEGFTPLIYTCFNEDNTTLNYLLHSYHSYLDIDKRNPYNGWTAIMYASFCNHVDYIILLHRYGANLDTQSIENMDENDYDNTGCTALMLACKLGYYSCVTFLLKHHCNIHLVDNHQRNALFYAIWGHHISIIKELVLYGIDIHIEDDSNKTPLLWAEELGYIDIMSYLSNMHIP